ncbi:MAG: RagB/SusD family nutrient uptake outer membrane protein [Muribaculum sp.]|nr:RagB/SusD family nutrient uptake outer membrane protein [Muribaculaceae bacterium]MCM1080284.1 RagB/SusD family nutrient uptake outer membrane protein [Muribaculum sp.]
MRPKTINPKVAVAWQDLPFNDFGNYFFENFFIDLADEGHTTADLQQLIIGEFYKDSFGGSAQNGGFNWDNRGQGKWDGDYWNRYQHMIVLIDYLLSELNNSQSQHSQEVGANCEAQCDELRILRAFYYLQMAKMYGDVPIWEKYISKFIVSEPSADEDPANPSNNISAEFSSSLRRDKAADVLMYAANECKEVIENARLPWRDEAVDNNRMTLAVGCAILSQSSLYAASPLYCDNRYLWDDAYYNCRFAYDELRKHDYHLYNTLADNVAYPNAYAEYFALDSYSCTTPEDKETIWGSPFKYRAGGLFVINGIPIGNNFQAGACPTQELIDAYDMLATGLPIYDLNKPYSDENHLNVNYNTASGYDPAKPYVGRDPRFYANTAYNGSKVNTGVRNQTVETYNNTNEKFGGNSAGKKGNCAIDETSRTYTRTGYYNRKFHQYKENRSTGYQGGTWRLFRLGEIYLNLAEAAIESGNYAQGLQYVNLIRHRAGFAPEVDVKANSIEEARLLVRHERQVELAFEGHRYFDERRWKKAGDEITEDKIKTGMWITTEAFGRNPVYHRFVIDPYKTGTTSMHYQAKTIFMPLCDTTIVNLATASGTDYAYWQNKGYGYPESSGISNAEADNDNLLPVIVDGLNVSVVGNQAFTVFNPQGQKVALSAAGNPVALPAKGLYIIVANGKSRKLYL